MLLERSKTSGPCIVMTARIVVRCPRRSSEDGRDHLGSVCRIQQLWTFCTYAHAFAICQMEAYFTYVSLYFGEHKRQVGVIASFLQTVSSSRTCAHCNPHQQH